MAWKNRLGPKVHLSYTFCGVADFVIWWQKITALHWMTTATREQAHHRSTKNRRNVQRGLLMMIIFNWKRYVDNWPLVLLDLHEQICVMLMRPHASVHILRGMWTHTRTRSSNKCIQTAAPFPAPSCTVSFANSTPACARCDRRAGSSHARLSLCLLKRNNSSIFASHIGIWYCAARLFLLFNNFGCTVLAWI